MRTVVTIAVLVLAGVLPVLAAELPSRKAGLWEVRTSFENHSGAGLTVQQCIDASTDQMMQSSAGPMAQAACSRRDILKSGDTVTIESTCMLAGKSATSHAVVTGSFDNAYTMTVTAQSDALPAGRMAMTVVAKWLGPCAADQKPGDLIMGNGVKMNIVDMRKDDAAQARRRP